MKNKPLFVHSHLQARLFMNMRFGNEPIRFAAFSLSEFLKVSEVVFI